MKGIKVDLIIHNAKIHSIDELDKEYEAFAIKDGKIIELGAERQILNKYRADEIIDAGGKDIYPGFTDAHGHLLSLIEQNLNLDLTDCKSLEEMHFRTEKYGAKTSRKFIVGRGWDQSLWQKSEFPTNEKLNILFPNTPVILIRVDGHAALINDYLLKKLNFTNKTAIEGGKIICEDDKPTGIILDNAITLATNLIPTYSLSQKKKELLKIQEELFQYGITGVHEAGINFEDIELFESLVNENKLHLDLYLMLYGSKENKDFATKHGKYINKNLKISSFKVIGDGSLGSRGACLKDHYTDTQSKGFLTTNKNELHSIAEFCRQVDYQMNTHAIGDSTNKIILDIIAKTFEEKKDHRWRIEHAQILDLKDLEKFSKYAVFPSVQPTHAVSDQRWAEQRIGKERLKGAYAYKSILEQTGIIAFGTDFPVESFNPFLTIHAACFRKDKNNFPSSGFLADEKISLENCIKAMTLWPAFASFQENKLGSLEKGKNATFFILEKPISKSGKYSENFAFMTFIKGKKVYSAE
jgi:hypothetical protein